MKLSILLGAIGIAFAIPSHPMYTPRPIKSSIKNGPIKSMTSQQARSYFYGALAMYNAKKEQTALLLADVHVKRPYNKDFHSLALKQQSDIIQIHDTLRDRKKKTHVIVEDSSIFSDNYIPGFMDNWNSPLIGLETICKQNALACTNVEFRYDLFDAMTMQTAQIIDKNSSSLTRDLVNYYGQHVRETPYDRHIDAAIINHINKTDAPFVLICTGAQHTGVVSKYLFKKGYSNSRHHIAPGAAPAFKNFLVHFDKNEPIAPIVNISKAKPPEPIQVADVIRDLIKKVQS